MSRDALEQNQIPIYFVAVIAAAIGGLIAPAAAQSLNVLVTAVAGAECNTVIELKLEHHAA